MLIRAGKPSGPLLAQTEAFFAENDALRIQTGELCALYRKQPLRTRCKSCDNPLGPATFVKLGIPYVVCEICGHLNGAHEDTDEFCRAVYTEDFGEAYGKSYTVADAEAYRKRMFDIYSPKATFLTQALEADGKDPVQLAYADLGAGSGYFVAALKNLGVGRAEGYEVSESQVEFANQMTKGVTIHTHRLEDTASISATVAADVVSMIGVLEHLRNPREVLDALSTNPRVTYLYISVPLFSPCVFFEMVFPTVFNRHLSWGHTHLYTETSLNWMCEKWGLTRIAEWWFGTDLVDLFRSVFVRLGQEPETNGVSQKWKELFAPAIDAMQLALDERRMSSEVHLLLKFHR